MRTVGILNTFERAPVAAGSLVTGFPIFGSTMGTAADFQGAYDLIADGKARPVVDRVFPLAEARAAHERLERGDQFGKIVLRID